MASTLNESGQNDVYDKYQVGGEPSAQYATQPDLQAMKPLGNGINGPVYDNATASIITTKSADMTNSSTDLNITASQENLSKKYKNPQVKQDKGITYTGQN